jgi:dTDP-4-amino-4,6-dideoxygalactose transaminase
VDEDTLGLSPGALRRFLETHARREGGRALQRESGRRLAACVPVHIFGHGCRIEEIAAICREWGIELVEDAAEALGGFRQGRHLGTFARLGTLSFNGNKTITTGGGGMLLTNDLELGARPST